jgi:hypothetical protein
LVPAQSKEERMRRAVWRFVLGVLLSGMAAAQETRGNISGTVRDNQDVIPRAAVTITAIAPNA